MTFDDETLMAFADGELEAAAAAEVEHAMRQDPAVARRVDDFRRVAAQVRRSQDAVLAEPVPLRLLAAARGGRRSRPRAIQAFGLAASLLVGVAVIWAVRDSSTPAIESSGRGLVAGAALDRALTDELSGEAGDGAVRVGLSFLDRDGRYCRTFQLEAVAGLACRVEARWQVELATSSTPGDDAAYRRAGSRIPDLVRSAVEERMDGEPLDAAAERAARDREWSVSAP